MKKIMFSDRFGLNAAVLDGSKTMTRRIIPLTAADEEYLDQAFDWDLRESVILDRYAQYEVGEVVAVAQSYFDMGWPADTIQTGRCMREGNHPDEPWDENYIGQKGDWHIDQLAGWTNKMFVHPMMCNNFIRFTERKIERLRSISNEDCLKEGVKFDPIMGMYYVPNLYADRKTKYTAGPTLFGDQGWWAYYNLCKKLRMVLDDSANPWVIAYSFQLQKGAEA